MQNDRLKNYLHLHFIVFIWGFTAILGALISIEAIHLVWYRMALATSFVGLFILWKKESLRISKKAIIQFAGVGVLIALHWLFFFAAIKESNVSLTLAILSTGAFFTSFLEPLFFKRKIISYEVVFGLIVILGLYLIFKAEVKNILGILLALSASFLGALFSVFNGKLIVKHTATLITFYELLFGVLFITIFLLINKDFDSSFFLISKNDWIFLLILASFCTAYAFIASIFVMNWLSPYTVMLTTNLEPIYGIILALIIFGDKEYMSSQFYMGAGIILITVIANGLLKTQRKK